MFCKHYILYFFTALLFMSCQGNNKVVEFSETEYTDSVLLAPNNPKESPVCQSSIVHSKCDQRHSGTNSKRKNSCRKTQKDKIQKSMGN